MKNPFERPERATFRERPARFIGEEIKPFADEWDEAGSFLGALYEKVGALGVFGFGVGQKYGGLGFDDCLMRVASNDEFARCGANDAPAGRNGRSASSGSIEKRASEEIKARDLAVRQMGL